MKYGYLATAVVAISVLASTASQAGWSVGNDTSLFDARPVVIATNSGSDGDLVIVCGVGKRFYFEVALPVSTSDSDNKKITVQVDGQAFDIKGASYDNFFAALKTNERPTAGAADVVNAMAKGKTFSVTKVGNKSASASWDLSGAGAAISKVNASCR